MPPKRAAAARALVAAGLVALALLAPGPARAQFAPVFGKVVEMGDMGRVALADPEAMRVFYEARGMRPLWLTGDASAMAEQAAPMLALMEDSWTQGLNPADYHVPEIRRLISAPSPENAARLEMILSDAAIRYGRDLTGMRVDPAAIGQNPKYWRRAASPGAVLSYIAASSDPVKTLEKMKPDSRLYEVLRAELVRLSREGHPYDHDLPMDFGGTLAPGDHARDVPVLRARLNVPHRAGNGPADFYDERLVHAVMAYQEDHNLEPDGYVGPQTLALLNRTSEDEREQIVANLERLRWLDQTRPERYLLVNIPSQKLWAVEDGKTAFEMKVVVGMKDRPTQSFRAMVQGIRFNPTWTVPLNLKMRDMLPHLQKDPGYLDEAGIELIRGSGADAVTLDPHQVDWANMTRAEMNRIRMVQMPGDHNALGQIRVLMPNEYDIYMHDTNHREFFGRTQRTYSSGCVRLSEPKKVAEFVMQRNENWNEVRLDRYLDRGKTADVRVDTPFPVFILYQSVWLNDKGRLIFGSDIYGEDRKLVHALAKMHAFWLPQTGGQEVSSAETSLLPTFVSAH